MPSGYTILDPATNQYGFPQTTNYFYDPNGNEVALEDPDANVTTWAYDGLGDQTQSSQGQIIATGTGSWTFDNLTLTPGLARSYEVYVQLASAPTSSSGWQNDYTVTADSFVASTSTITLGGGWYELGVATLTTDTTSSLTVSYTPGSGGPTGVCLVGYSNQDSYDAAGELTETIDRDNRATTYQYDGIGRETSENWYATSDTSGSPTETISYTYDATGQLARRPITTMAPPLRPLRRTPIRMTPPGT